MKITIHAGTHKTATTSFQKLCFLKKKDLCAQGLFIPEFTDKKKIITFAESRGMRIYDFSLQHNFLAWYLQLKELDEVKDFLNRAYLNANKENCDSVLISAEDLENILMDDCMANNIESIATEVGFDQIEWIFVKRSPFDYLKSLYSEISKYGLIIDFYQLYEIIMIHGYYNLSSRIYNYIYIFDLYNLVELFKRNHKSTITIFQFEDFKIPYLGFPIFNKLIPNSKSTEFAFESTEEKNIIANKSLNNRQIEFNYLCNFLRLSPEIKSYEKNKYIFDILINHRQGNINKENEKIKEKINKKFG